MLLSEADQAELESDNLKLIEEGIKEEQSDDDGDDDDPDDDLDF